MDPILGPENLLKTGFAQKGLPSIISFDVGSSALRIESGRLALFCKMCWSFASCYVRKMLA